MPIFANVTVKINNKHPTAQGSAGYSFTEERSTRLLTMA